MRTPGFRLWNLELSTCSDGKHFLWMHLVLVCPVASIKVQIAFVLS